MSTFVYNIIVFGVVGKQWFKNVRMTGVSYFNIADSNKYQLSSIYKPFKTSKITSTSKKHNRLMPQLPAIFEKTEFFIKRAVFPVKSKFSNAEL